MTTRRPRADGPRPDADPPKTPEKPEPLEPIEAIEAIEAMEAMEAMDPAPLARSGDNAPGAPHELARAFQLNAEILRRIQETQREIADRFERSDRSEMVVRSADALNETFRGVRASQKALLDRIEETKPKPGRTFALISAACVVVALVVLWGGWRLMNAAREQSDDQIGSAWDADRGALEGERERVDRLARERDDALRERDESLRDIEVLRVDLDEAEEQRLELARKIGALSPLTRQVEQLGQDLRLRDDRLRDREARIEALRKELADAQRREGESAGKLASAERLLTELRTEIARREGLAEPSEIEEGGEESALPEGANTNEGQIEALVSRLNRLLQGDGSKDSYRFESLRGVSGKTLLGVDVRNRGAGGRMRKEIVAERCRVVLKPDLKRIDLQFESGSVKYSGTRAQFYQGRYTLYVLDVDVDAWRRAGLTILEER